MAKTNSALHNLILAAAYQRKGDSVRAAKAFSIAASSPDLKQAARMVQAYNERQVIKAETLDAPDALEDPNPGKALREEPDENKQLREVQEADLNDDFADMGLTDEEDEDSLEVSATEDEDDKDAKAEEEEKDADEKKEDAAKGEPFGGKKAPPFGKGGKPEAKDSKEDDKKDEKSSVRILSAAELATIRFRRSLENVSAMNEAAAKAKAKKAKKPMAKGKK